MKCKWWVLTVGSVYLFRYGLFDFEYMHQCQGTSESSKKQKLFLMSWCPDTAKVSGWLYKNDLGNSDCCWWVYLQAKALVVLLGSIISWRMIF